MQPSFEVAKGKMIPVITKDIEKDIGGDNQVVSTLNSSHENITFKHILLPVWISSYKYNGKVYRFLVNARTGEVQGERPYSIGKILTLILSISAVIALIVFTIYMYGQNWKFKH